MCLQDCLTLYQSSRQAPAWGGDRPGHRKGLPSTSRSALRSHCLQRCWQGSPFPKDQTGNHLRRLRLRSEVRAEHEPTMPRGARPSREWGIAQGQELERGTGTAPLHPNLIEGTGEGGTVEVFLPCRSPSLLPASLLPLSVLLEPHCVPHLQERN